MSLSPFTWILDIGYWILDIESVHLDVTFPLPEARQTV